MTSKLKFPGMSILAVVLLEGSLAAMCMIDPSPPCQAFWNAEVVFSGTVTKLAYSDTYQKGEGKDQWNYRDRIAHFSVDSLFRGKLGSQVDVIATEIMRTPIKLADGSPGFKSMGESDCEYRFKEGERYLVYAYFRKTNDGTLMVPFNRTRPLAQANDDLEFINGLSHAGPGGRIYGQAKLTKQSLKNGGNTEPVRPIADVKIVADGMNRHFETITNVEGRYELKELPPGEYSVQALFSTEFRSYPARKVRVSDRGCVETNIFTEADGRISGRVLDAHGQPVPKMRLDLALADQDPNDPNPQNLWAYADDAGNYEFKSVPPGRYVMGIRLNAIREKDFPYPRAYYPNTSALNEARVFTLSSGEKIAGVDFVMPAQLSERTIEGRVVWPDGRPVPKASITVMIADFSYGTGYGAGITDEAGRFSFKLFNGFSYWINAVVSLAPASQMHAEPVDLASSGDVKDLQLVVSSPMGNCERCRFRYGAKKKR